MKKSKTRQFAIGLMAAAFALVGLLNESICVNAQTKDSAMLEDSVGNVFQAGQNVSLSEEIRNELFMAGYNVEVNQEEIHNNAFIAGYNVNINAKQIGNSLYAAGYLVALDSIVLNNAYLAGNNISVSKNSLCQALKVAGENIALDGNCLCVYAVGDTIYFNGQCASDVYLEGANVEIGKDAVVGGSLIIKSASEPSIAEKASIYDYTYEKMEKQEKDSVETVKKSVKLWARIKATIYWTIVWSVIAVLLCIFCTPALEEAKEMFHTSPVAMLVTGLVALFVSPIAIILCAITVIGLPVAGFAVLILTVILWGGTTFAAASIGRLVFDKIRPGLKSSVASVVSVAIITLLKIIPFIGGLITLVGMIYTLGFILQHLFLNTKKNTAVCHSESDATPTENYGAESTVEELFNEYREED